jgi:hypothetical protein
MIHIPEKAHLLSMLIPAGATVTIADGPLNGLPMVNAIWEAKAVMLFKAPFNCCVFPLKVSPENSTAAQRLPVLLTRCF